MSAGAAVAMQCASAMDTVYRPLYSAIALDAGLVQTQRGVATPVLSIARTVCCMNSVHDSNDIQSLTLDDNSAKSNGGVPLLGLRRKQWRILLRCIVRYRDSDVPERNARLQSAILASSWRSDLQQDRWVSSDIRYVLCKLDTQQF